MNELNRLVEQLLKNESVLIFPHVLIDGDSLGSSVALCEALRKMGKQADIIIEEPIPAYLRFLDQGYCSMGLEPRTTPDICIAVDCSDEGRLASRKELFFTGKQTYSLDHHITNSQFADVNIVDTKAAATAEIIFALISLLPIMLDQNIAEAIYTGITTDTGNFQYSNTTKNSHLIVAALFDAGIDQNKISIQLYQNIRHEKLLIANLAYRTTELLCNGLVAVAFVSRSMLEETGASMEETEGLIETLRSIQGVEVAVLIKESSPKEIKVSMRSKTYGNVAVIAKAYGGGGHVRAAGFSSTLPLHEVKDRIIRDVCAQMKAYIPAITESTPV